MIKTILSFTLVIFMSGCAITPTYEDIPKTEEDFKLSTDEILNKFPAITNHHLENKGDSNKTIPKYTDLVSDWGEPVSKKEEQFRYYWNITHYSGIGYVALGGLGSVWLGFAGIMAVTTPMHETYTWHKKDYIIDATFYNPKLTKAKPFAYWKWKKREENYSTKIILPEVNKNFFFKFGLSIGGEKVLKTKDSEIDYLSIGHGITMQLGYSYNLFSDNSRRLKFAAGIRDSGLAEIQSGAKIFEYPVDAVLSVKTDTFPLYVGVGVGYKINPTIRNYSDDVDKFQLDNSVSFILELESSIFTKNDTSIRYEFLNYTGDGINSIKGDTFSVFFNHYF